MSVHVFGIRHHGPGSARSLLAALADLTPDAVLIEGPPDADRLIPLAAHPDMQPPVALLIYNANEPKQAGWYPFAAFSPEWQALQYALRQGIHVQFMDLPQKHQLALSAAPLETPPDSPDLVRSDPLQTLAYAAGDGDGERWWEHMVEERRDSTRAFEAIYEAMSALRRAADAENPEMDPREALREAWMRKTARAAARKFQRIAVICGAWHAPVIHADPSADDDELLKNLPSVTTRATWAPWTYGRLSRDSGYGAGIQSPGWYQHLWETPASEVAVRWLSRVAALLRNEDLSASTAQVIDAVRLAETLASLRGRPTPRLIEMNEAALSVFCRGDSAPLKLIHQKLIVGETMGAVPADTPSVPLQRDLETLQKRLRLKPSLDERLLDLDLRAPTDLARSHLLHRLSLLNVDWGQREKSAVQSTGTFHEYWRLQWQPELTVAVIEASVWGNTILDAATNRAQDAADGATSLPLLTRLVEDVLQADLPAAVDHVMRHLQDEAALTSDITVLMDALPPMVDVVRYGNVRKTDAVMVAQVADGLVTRVCIGLLPACLSLDDDAAAVMMARIIQFNALVRLLNRPDHIDQWHTALQQLAARDSLHGLIAGRAVRILHDSGVIVREQARTWLRFALSAGVEPVQAAFWIEGFLKSSGAVLLHDDDLWQLLDDWIATLSLDRFEPVLPLLRRTFSTFHVPERHQMGERARQGRRAPAQRVTALNQARADRVLPLLGRLLGLDDERFQ